MKQIDVNRQGMGSSGESVPLLDYSGEALRRRGWIGRVWDTLVGLTMIVASLVAQAVFILLVVGMGAAGVVSYFGTSERWVFVSEAVAFVFLNWLTFGTFKRQRVARRTRGLGSAFFLLPRGAYRIWYGRETYAEEDEFVDL